MTEPEKLMAAYGRSVSALVTSPTTTEQTYYADVRNLLAGILGVLKLPVDVRINTAEPRVSGGVDMPDIGIYDAAGDFALVCGELKLPSVGLHEMAASTERNDQIGRYLAQTGVVLLSNVWSFGVLSVLPGHTVAGPVPPSARRVELTVELWPGSADLIVGAAPPAGSAQALLDLVEAAVTRYAPITEPSTLARVLARQARRAKAALPIQFGQAVRSLADDFGRALGLSFLGEDGEEFFRSSLVQTVFYGLFAGWMLHKSAGGADPFRWQNLPATLRIPFLGDLFHDIQHPMRIAELGLGPHLDLAADACGRVDEERFFQRIHGEANGDPVQALSSSILYFYEPFLEAFDPELRKCLGVWYTPPEIVRYQVKKADQLLRHELHCPLGLADDRVVVLDPCCGTGAYLVEALLTIAETLKREGVGADLGEHLARAASHRIIGFEILTAPFVISHLQIHLMLAGMGAAPQSGERPAVYLTNALTGWSEPGQVQFIFPELQREHDAARQVKAHAKIIVVLGNPPYNRFAGAPIDEEKTLVDAYKGVHRNDRGRQVGQTDLYAQWGISKHLLDDLYIRFFRLAELRIAEEAEYGIVSFISNSSFYTGRSHPIMRQSLVHGFDEVWIDNLNGDKYRTGKIIPAGMPGAGSADQSVFTTAQDARGIQVGTAITTLLKRRGHRPVGPAAVHCRDFWGRAESKRAALARSLLMEEWAQAEIEAAALTPEGPREYQIHAPRAENRWKLLPRNDCAGYGDWPALDELFPIYYQGVNPNRGIEGSLVDTDGDALRRRMQEYFSALDYDELARRHPVLCQVRAGYDPRATRDELRRESCYNDDRVVPYLVFPFDLRRIYYQPDARLLNRRRPDLWDNCEGNEFLLAVPQPRRVSEARPIFATTLFDLHAHDRGTVGFPAETPLAAGTQHALVYENGSGPGRPRRANISADVWDTLREAWSLTGDVDGDDARAVVRQLFRASLALCHSPRYQEDHAESLAQDWAHVPIPIDRAIFDELASAGGRIAELLDPAADARQEIRDALGGDVSRLAVLRRSGGGSLGPGEAVLTIAHFGAAAGGWRPTGEGTGDLYINRGVYFENVPEAVWRYELGGYPVLKKWLGYREARRRGGRPLTVDERDHLRSVVQRIAALLALGPELDRLYERAAACPLTMPAPPPKTEQGPNTSASSASYPAGRRATARRRGRSHTSNSGAVGPDLFGWSSDVV
jgi:hypothetical protein